MTIVYLNTNHTLHSNIYILAHQNEFVETSNRNVQNKKFSTMGNIDFMKALKVQLQEEYELKNNTKHL